MVPNHAITQIFFHFHAFTQSIKNWDFHAKTLKMGEKHAFHRITQVFLLISRNHAHYSTFSRITHASRFTQSRRNKIIFHAITQKNKANHAITQPYGGPPGVGFVCNLWCGGGHYGPPSIKSTKIVIFGPKCIQKSKMSKIIGKTQKKSP